MRFATPVAVASIATARCCGPLRWAACCCCLWLASPLFGNYNLEQAAGLPGAQASRWMVSALAYYARIMPPAVSCPTLVLACLYIYRVKTDVPRGRVAPSMQIKLLGRSL